MKKYTAFLLVIAIPFFFSSCFLFKKTQGPKLPPPQKKVEEKHEIPEAQKPKQKGKAPFDVDAFDKKKQKPVYDVALMLPLNVDQVVSDTNFAIGNQTQLPGETLNSLEFYEGALMALDSLRQQNIRLRLHVYDTKSEKEDLSQLLNSHKLDSADLLLGAVSGNAFKKISAFAKKQQINFVSATYPNDGGVTKNPFLIILNSTLRVHCTAIQDFAQQKFGDKKITVIYYNNAQGKQNLQYLQQAYQQMNNGRKAPLNPFEWTNKTTIQDLIPHLDQQKTNVIILTTLYPDVSLNVIGQLAGQAKQYNINVVGMPTLEGLKALKKEEYKGITLYYSSVFPYVNLASYPSMKRMMWRYFNQYHARPGNDALTAYETLFYFGHLLHKNGSYFNNDLNNPSGGTLMTDFNFTPIYHNRDSNPPDYFENTHIYFLRERDGKVTAAY